MNRCMLIGYLASKISIFNKNRLNSLAAWLTLIFFGLRKKRKKINNFIKSANRHFHIRFLVRSGCILQKMKLHFKFRAQMPLLMRVSIQVVSTHTDAHITQLKLTALPISSSWKHSKHIWHCLLKYTWRCRSKAENICHRTTKFRLLTWNKFQELCYYVYFGPLTIMWQIIVYVGIKQKQKVIILCHCLDFCHYSIKFDFCF